MPLKSRHDGQVEIFQHNGREIKVTWHCDNDANLPWIETDFYGIVSRWEQRDKRPGEVIVANDRGHKLFYDFAGTVARFRKDGMTGRDAHAAALHSCERVRKFCDNQWHYIGATAEVEKLYSDGTGYFDDLYGIESDCAADSLMELLEEAKAAIDEHQRKNVVTVRLLLACA